MSPPSKLSLYSAAIVAIGMSLATTAPAGAGVKTVPVSRRDAVALERARAGAVERLKEPVCQQVLSDFRDARGLTLQENLVALGLSAADYLRTLPFVDGSPIRLCKQRSVVLAAAPGFRSIFVCPAEGALDSRFTWVQRTNPWLAEAIVIHEMLHTLGLGEDPPTSEHIDWQVQLRCQP